MVLLQQPLTHCLPALVRCYDRDFISKGCQTDIRVARFMHFFDGTSSQEVLYHFLEVKTSLVERKLFGIST